MSLDCIQMLDKLQEEYFFRLPHACILADYVWPGVIMSRKRILDIQKVEFGPDDILISTYPKSGTTWMSELVSALVYKGDTTSLKKLRQDLRVPWLELENDYWWIQLYMEFDRIFMKKDVKRALAAHDQRRRVCFTHLPLELLPESVLQANCRMIYVARNPKDNAVSFFHHHRMARFLGVQKNFSWNEFFALYVTGSLYCGSWFEHVLGYWRFAQLHPERVLFVKFEDMKKDLAGEADKIIRFLGMELTEEQVKQVLNHCSFESMKNNKMANRDISWMFDQNVSKFMRKGEVGDWKNYFTVVQSDLFDTLYVDKMRDSGLEFRFE